MRIHANARTCPNSRRLLVRRIEDEGWALIPAAEAAGISERSARKWLLRWRWPGAPPRPSPRRPWPQLPTQGVKPTTPASCSS